MIDVSRRRFIGQFTRTGAALAMAGPLEAFARRVHDGVGPPIADVGYGPLLPVRDETTGLPLVSLPKGFKCISFGWTGDRLSDEGATPAAHDGMACFATERAGRVRLVRNHELGGGAPFVASPIYDPLAAGGTTNLTFDTGAGRLIDSRGSLAGTVRNCAGGPTPWGTWLTCEESVAGPETEGKFTKPHGYIFDVPVEAGATAQPILAMGRFVHEAVAVDPATSIVYETEDADTSGLYRFVPARPRDLTAGGTLQMLAILDRPRMDLRRDQPKGVRYPVAWVDIAEPDRAHFEKTDGKGVFRQGLEAGGATFARLEGAWYGGGLIYFTSTSGGNARMGQVWELDPVREELRLVIESPGAEVLNMPDNICVSPRGGLLLCEDGTSNPCLHGVTRDGRIFRFGRNTMVLAGERNGLAGDFRNREFAGACFSPDGQWLFVNIQTPGVTLAITGPWEAGEF
jgi:secreted PhoX family phosphatase